MMCRDPKDLNKEIKREHFQIPTTELANVTCLSKLDATAGFHQIKLDRPSSLLTTFNTPFALEVFHKTRTPVCRRH